jgi:hypothetical protein
VSSASVTNGQATIRYLREGRYQLALLRQFSGVAEPMATTNVEVKRGVTTKVELVSKEPVKPVPVAQAKPTVSSSQPATPLSAQAMLGNWSGHTITALGGDYYRFDSPPGTWAWHGVGIKVGNTLTGAGRSLNAKAPGMGMLFHATVTGEKMHLDLIYITDGEGNLVPVKAPWKATEFTLPKFMTKLGTAAGETPHVFTGMTGGYAFKPVKEDWLTVESPRGPQGWAGIAVAWKNHCYGVVKLARDSGLAFVHMEQNNNNIQSRLVPVADGKGILNEVPSGLRVDRHDIKR